MLGIVTGKDSDGKYLVEIYRLGSPCREHKWTAATIRQKVADGMPIVGVSDTDIVCYASYTEFMETEIMTAKLFGCDGYICEPSQLGETGGFLPKSGTEFAGYGVYLNPVALGNVKSVVIPNGVLYVGAPGKEVKASALNNSIETIEMPDTVEKLSGRLCTMKYLTHVQLSAQLKQLPAYCFTELLQLHEIYLPDSIQTIGEGCFFNCDIKRVTHWPENLKAIQKSAFGNTLLQGRLAFGENLQKIGARAFVHTHITELIIPAGVEVGDGAFQDCSDLTYVEFPTTSVLTYKPKSINTDRNIFSNCPNIREVKIVGDGSYISDELCSHLSALQKVTFPETLHEISHKAFAYTPKLTEITLPSGLSSISVNAFQASGITEIYIPDSVYAIGKGAFQYCKALRSVHLPKSLTVLKAEVFAHCPLLEHIELPETIERIEAFAFYECDALTSITLPSSCRELQDSAFSGCQNLASITLNEGLCEIGYGCFYDCISLTSLHIPDSVEKMESDIPKSVTALYISENIEDVYRLFNYTTSANPLTITMKRTAKALQKVQELQGTRWHGTLNIID